jgi:hypothetical protein
VVLISALALVMASSAPAANAAPNPSFEVACGAATTACFWPDSSDAFVANQRDVTTAKTGAASYRQALFGNARGRLTTSECVDMPIAAGNVTVSFSYVLVAGTNVSLVRMRALPWSNTRCTGSAAAALQASATPIDDGGWHNVSNQLTAGSSTRSLRLEIAYDCNALCPNTQVNWDDLLVGDPSPPTAVTVTAPTAQRQGVVRHDGEARPSEDWCGRATRRRRPPTGERVREESVGLALR